MSPTGALRVPEIRSTQDSAFHAIQNAIFRGELKLGQRIVEEDIAGALGISRATLREALRRLQQVGLIQIKPHKGTFVTHLTLAKVERICRLRAVLEGLAARYACESLDASGLAVLSKHVQGMQAAAKSRDLDSFLEHDRSFHVYIWKAGQDEQLEYILTFLSTPYFAFVASLATHLFSDVAKILQAHKKYLAVLRTGDAESAQREVQRIHEQLAQGISVDIRKAQAKWPGLLDPAG